MNERFCKELGWSQICILQNLGPSDGGETGGGQRPARNNPETQASDRIFENGGPSEILSTLFYSVKLGKVILVRKGVISDIQVWDSIVQNILEKKSYFLHI